MLDKSDESLTRVYNALANPIRRQIVQILKETGKAGFKELHDTLKISVGALYHHLDSLEGFVAQGADRKYVLTDDGRAAINAFSTGEERIIANAAKAPPGESRFGFFSRELLFGRTVFNYLSQEPLRSLPIAAMILALGGAISFMTNLEPILLFYHRSGGDLSLINGTAFAMLPLLLVPGLILLVQPFSAVIQSATAFTILLQVGVQVWVVCLLSSAISISKGLKMERTALISLAVMYLNITAVIFALSLGLF